MSIEGEVLSLEFIRVGVGVGVGVLLSPPRPRHHGRNTGCRSGEGLVVLQTPRRNDGNQESAVTLDVTGTWKVFGAPEIAGTNLCACVFLERSEGFNGCSARSETLV